MQALSKDLKKQHAELLAAITSNRTTVEEALEKFTAEVEALFEQIVTPAVEAYNEKLEEAETFATDEAAAAIEEYMDERSEKWHEGEAAEAYDNWKSAFENIDLTRLEIECPEEVIETPDFEALDEFGDLPLKKEDAQ